MWKPLRNPMIILLKFENLFSLPDWLLQYIATKYFFLILWHQPKVHMSYCHHFASVVWRPVSIHFLHFRLFIKNHWANQNTLSQVSVYRLLWASGFLENSDFAYINHKFLSQIKNTKNLPGYTGAIVLLGSVYSIST